MATAVLLCFTTITVIVLGGMGWLVMAMRPRRVRISIGIARFLQVKLEFGRAGRRGW